MHSCRWIKICYDQSSGKGKLFQHLSNRKLLNKKSTEIVSSFLCHKVKLCARVRCIKHLCVIDTIQWIRFLNRLVHKKNSKRTKCPKNQSCVVIKMRANQSLFWGFSFPLLLSSSSFYDVTWLIFRHFSRYNKNLTWKTLQIGLTCIEILYIR